MDAVRIGRADVRYDEASIDAARIEAAITEAGYRATARHDDRPDRRHACRCARHRVGQLVLLLRRPSWWRVRGARASGIQRITVQVKGGYAPAVIQVRAGTPVRLEFHRDEDQLLHRGGGHSRFRDPHLPAGPSDDADELHARAGRRMSSPAAWGWCAGPSSRNREPEVAMTDTLTAAGETCTIPVTGMTCAACSGRVQRSLEHTPGVDSANVNLMTGAATVAYDPAVTSPERLVEAIRDTGYGAELPALEESAEAAARRAGRGASARGAGARAEVRVSALVAVGTMLFGMGEGRGGRPHALSPARAHDSGRRVGRPSFLYPGLVGLPASRRRHEHADRCGNRRGVPVQHGHHAVRRLVRRARRGAARVLRDRGLDHRARAARQPARGAGQGPDVRSHPPAHRSPPCRPRVCCATAARTRFRSPSSRAGRRGGRAPGRERFQPTASCWTGGATSTNRC